MRLLKYHQAHFLFELYALFFEIFQQNKNYNFSFKKSYILKYVAYLSPQVHWPEVLPIVSKPLFRF